MSATATSPGGTAPEERKPTLGEGVRRTLEGDLGPVRVLIVLAVVWLIFGIANDRFLSAVNLTNLVLQMTAVAMISVGVVLVLLLGEIDLSVGAVSGFASAVMAVVLVRHGWNPYLAMLAALATGALIGLIQGASSTLLGIPSFIITLAGLLAWQGAQLQVLGDQGTVNINEPAITNLTGSFLGSGLGWLLGVVAVAVIAVLALNKRRRRAARGLANASVVGDVLRVVASAVAILGGIAVVNNDRGVPASLLILVAVIVVMAYVTQKTRWGQHLYAVGGNAEAARRAGINVNRLKITVFVLASTLAAAGGILAASRLLAVNQSSGGSDLLLFAIAGPVIAGVSLFGGRGSVWAALLGGLVIQSIQNGMDLLALESGVKFMVTGGVLFLAVVLDAVATRRRRASGRA